MRIDWFTFGAQVLNFLVLVFLLRRFLYRPVLAVVDRREEEIADRLDEAERTRETARDEARRYRELQERLEERRAALVREAEEEAESRRSELREEARKEADQVRDAWRESIRRQKEEFLELLRTRMSRELYDGIRKALADLADEELENRVVSLFLRRLTGMEEEGRELGEAVRRSGETVRIRSAFALDEARKEELEDRVRRWLGDEAAEVVYRVDPELGIGLEVTGGDRRIGWSAASYLEVLETETMALLEAEAS